MATGVFKKKKSGKKSLSWQQRKNVLRVATDLFFLISNPPTHRQEDVFCFNEKALRIYVRLQSYGPNLHEAADFLREHIIGRNEIFSKQLLKNAKKIIDAAESWS